MDASQIWGQQSANTNSLVQALTQFFSDPQRIAELSSVPQAQADQAYSATNQQFSNAGRNTGFDLARRGLQGGSMEQERYGDFNTAYNQSVAGIENQRQSGINQGQAQLMQQYMQALQSAYSQNPLTQAALQANLQGLGANTVAAQQNGALAQQNQALDAFNSQEFSQALGNPINLYASYLQGERR